MTKSSTGLEANVAGMLCYLLGWLTGLVFLILEKDSEFVKFHARQSAALFGLLTVASIIAPVLPIVGGLLAKLVAAASFIAWVLMLIFAAQGKQVSIPVVSDLADKLKD